MSIRATVEEKPAVVISKAEFEEDWKRGYAITFFSEGGEQVIRDRVTGKEIRKKIEPVLNYCCMRCQFSTIMVDFMKEHLFHAVHHWDFTPFLNPYGHFATVEIEGIADYTEFMKENQL